MKIMKFFLCILVFVSASAGIVFNSGTATAKTYIEALFDPVTETELAEAAARINYEPSCSEFMIKDVYRKDAGYEIRKVSYITDGLQQTGLYGKPDGEGPFPLLIMSHGGFSGIGEYDMPRLIPFLEKGYAVAMATFRGEEGIAGLAEGSIDVLGDESHDVLDLMECAAMMEETDPEKIVMWGGSHGGGITLTALTLTDRVKAAAVIVGPANMFNDNNRKMASDWNSQPARVEVLLNIFMTQPAMAQMKKVLGVSVKNKSRETFKKSRLEMLRRSPLYFADKINAPLIMYYGGKDPVASGDDGKAIAENLNARGIESHITVFEEYGHGFSAESYDLVEKEIDAFFTKYLNAN